jgi:hypothetical protein
MQNDFFTVNAGDLDADLVGADVVGALEEVVGRALKVGPPGLPAVGGEGHGLNSLFVIVRSAIDLSFWLKGMIFTFRALIT